MRLAENRTIAWIVFAMSVVIALSLSGNALKKNALEMRLDTIKVFYTGANADGLSIDSDLKARAKDAYTLIGIAGRYSQIDETIVQAATAAQRAMDEANGLAQLEIKARSQANAQLGRAIEDLYTALNNSALSEADRRDVQSVYDDFKSHGNTIGRDPYNELAAQFNRDADAMYSQFPASMFKNMQGGAPTLELF